MNKIQKDILLTKIQLMEYEVKDFKKLIEKIEVKP
jgi:hypothetical protein